MDKFYCSFISVTGQVLDNRIIETREELEQIIASQKERAISFRNTLHADVVLYAAESETGHRIYLYLTPLSMYNYRVLTAHATATKVKLHAAFRE